MMALISKEVVLGDLDRAKVIINQANKHLFIIPNEIKQLLVRYESLFEKWKKTKYDVVEGDAKAAAIIEKEHIYLENGLQPIT